jgi:antitoxin component YwqK of YwqJK toxin-antitoxin module
MRILFLSNLLLFSLIISAQPDTLVYYFHKNGNPCPKEYASFVGYGIKEKGLIRYSNYSIEDTMLIMTGYYADSALTIKEGFFQYLNPVGTRESEGIYKNNIKEGWWAFWHSSELNKPSDSIFFETGKDIITISFTYYYNGQPSSRILNNHRDKIKEFVQWSADSLLVSKAVWIDGTGDQIDYYPGGEIKSVASYKKGNRKPLKCYQRDGSPISKEAMEEEDEKNKAILFKENEEKAPAFPRGHEGFRAYLEKHFRIPAHLNNLVNTLYTITIIFDLDEKGLAKNIRILESNNLDLKQAVADFFRDIPRWDMKDHKEYGPIIYQILLRLK